VGAATWRRRSRHDPDLAAGLTEVPVTTSTSTSASAGARWPIVDRWELTERIAAARAGCVLRGPAGAGKSTAARVALPPAAGTSVPVAVTGVTGLAAIPFGALSMAEMTAPIPSASRGGGPAAAPPAAGGDDLVARLRRWLAWLRTDGVAVIIEDPHALDAESATMLADEMRRGLTAVVTHRPTEPPTSPLAEAIDDLALPVIEVEPFDRSMVELAVEQAIGAVPTAEAVDHLAALSGGNPMLLREIVGDLSARGAWIERRGTVAIATDANPSDHMADLLRRRFPAEPGAQRLLGLVAYAGSIPAALAHALSASAVQEDLVARGWLTRAADGEQLAIAHPLMAQFVREQTSDTQIPALLRDSVRAIDPDADLDASSRLMVLRWSLIAGTAIDRSTLQWGRAEAARRFDRDLAVLIADRLLQDVPTIDTTIELTLALAQADRYDEAVAVLARARDGIDDAADPSVRAEVVELARFLLRFAGPLARMKRWGTTPPGVDRVTATWADSALETDAFSSLLDAFESLAIGALPEARLQADAVRAAGIDGLGGDADEVTMLASLYSGDEDEALGAFGRLGARLSDPSYRHPKAVVIDAAASSLLMLAGQFEQAYAFDRQVQDVARAQNDGERLREMTGHLGMSALFLGRVDDAVDAFVRHRDHPAAPNSLRTLYLGGLAQALALGGQLAEAERVLADALRQRDVVSPMMHTDFENLAAMTQHLLGRHEDAEAGMRTALSLAADWRNSRGELMALHGLARMGRVGDADVRALEQRRARGAHEPAPAFTEGVFGMVDAVATQHAERMADAAEAFAATGMGLGAAEAYAAACRMATSSARRIPSAKLEAWRRELDQWLARCPGLQGQTVLVERSADALTEREREVAALAAGGMANAVIASRLGISVRTVENTLHRTFVKLGITARDELTAAMT
jgi:DNA-binding CsgD family transcriptional regulator/tetratricopeptide (TPR) repeat protein